MKRSTHTAWAASFGAFVIFWTVQLVKAPPDRRGWQVVYLVMLNLSLWRFMANMDERR